MSVKLYKKACWKHDLCTIPYAATYVRLGLVIYELFYQRCELPHIKHLHINCIKSNPHELDLDGGKHVG